jgi:UDP-glucose 4-epimerase
MRSPSRNGARRELPPVLITGGAGFVGSHLCETMVHRGHPVVALDNLSTGRLENLAAVIDAPNFELVVDDVRDEQAVDRLVRHGGTVFHLAAAVGVRLILGDPLASMDSNVHGTQVVLERAASHRTKVVIASTSEVYGKSARIPQREDDDVVLGATRFARWSYAASKMLDEFLALAHWRATGLPVVVFRLFNTVGPRQTGRYGMVVPRFVEAALNEESLQVYGDGLQSRCFLHVRDAVQAIAGLAEAPEAVGGVFNVGSRERVTILELARRVVRRVEPSRLRDGSTPIALVPYHVAYPGGDFEDIRCRVPDVRRIQRTVGWKPRIRLNQIIDDVIAERSEERAQISGSLAPVA